MRVGDLVRMNSVYPIWLLSVGVGKKDVGIILNHYEYENNTKMVEVFWFSVGKSYLVQQKLLLKVN